MKYILGIQKFCRLNQDITKTSRIFMNDADKNKLTRPCLRFLPENVIWINDTFENNLENKTRLQKKFEGDI